MRDKKKVYLQECMDTVFRTPKKGKSQNILLIKHNNAFCMDEKDVEGRGIYHKYHSLYAARPYEPFRISSKNM